MTQLKQSNTITSCLLQFKRLLLVALVLYSSMAYTQVAQLDWVKYTENGFSRAYGWTADVRGNVYATGAYGYSVYFSGCNDTIISNYQNLFVYKTGPEGRVRWLKNFYPLEGWALAADESENVFVTGFNGFTLKLDSLGHLQWAVQPEVMTGGPLGRAIVLDKQGNIFTAGTFGIMSPGFDFDPGPGKFTLNAIGPMDTYVQKLNKDGIFQWALRIGGNQCQPNAMAIDEAGSIYLTGYFIDQIDCDPGPSTFLLTSPGWNAYVVKLNSNGNLVWAKHFGGTYTIGSSIAVDSKGNVYTVGTFYGTCDFDPGAGTSYLKSAGANDGYISKLDVNGNLVWTKTVKGKFFQYCTAIARDTSQNLCVSGGFADSTGFNTDFDPGDGSMLINEMSGTYFLKLDTNGNFMDIKVLSGTKSEVSVKSSANGNIYGCGNYYYSSSFNVGTDTIIANTGIGNMSTFVCKLNHTVPPPTVASNPINLSEGVYPNPVINTVHIRLPGYKNETLLIYSSTGALIMQAELNEGQLNSDLTGLADGVYLLVTRGSAPLYRAKVVKCHD